jgi:hypothetical protein
MTLEKIKGSYDAIFSLGHLCLAAIQLKKFNIRPFSGVLDWVASYSLTDVNRLLQNQFVGFMELPNLKVVGHASPLDLLVLDEAYNIAFNHDFKTNQNTVSHLAAYHEVKKKYDRRVQRFLEKMATCKRILFIRTEGTFPEVSELESILLKMVKNDFRILVVNHTNVNNMVEINLPSQKVSAVELPHKEIWNSNDRFWAEIFRGVHLSN